MEKKQRLILSYLDGDNIQTYTMQVNEAEHKIFNKVLFTNRMKPNGVGMALKALAESNICTKHHKSKISDIISKTMMVNFKLN